MSRFVSGRDARARLGVLGALGVLFGLLTTLLVAVPQAQAADGDLEVRLTSITPTSMDDSHGTVTLTGTVTNRGTRPLYTVQVLICRNPEPITSTTLLARALAEDPAAPTCLRLTNEGNFAPIADAFEPGRTAAFTVSASLAQLGFTKTAVHLVGVHARASVDRSSTYLTLGRARTFLPVVVGQAPASTASSIVWLGSHPSAVAPGVFVDDHLADEFAGRLLTLVRSAARPDVNWVVDPALLEDATTMANGYRIRSGDGGSVPGQGSAAATAWLAEFAKLPRDKGYRLPYANPDLTLSAADPSSGVVDRAVRTKGLVASVADLPLVVRAPNGGLDESFLRLAGALGPSLILTNQTSGAAATSADGVLVVRTGEATYGGGPGPDGDTDLQLAQRRLADSLVLALEQGGSVRLVTTPKDAVVDAEPLGVWQRRAPLAALTPLGEWTRGDQPAGGVLTPATTTAIASARGQFAAFGTLTADEAGVAATSEKVMARATSAAWSDDAAALAYLGAATARIARAFGDGVQLRVVERWTMTSKSNEFPITLANTLDTDVTVRVVFDSANESRVVVPDSDPVTIPANTTVTLNVNPEASVTGVVDVTARVETLAGTQVGGQEKFTIEATEAGRVAWVIVGVSAVVLVVSTMIRIRQLRKGES